MSFRSRVLILLPSLLAIALASAGPAQAAKGVWSLGGNFGTGIYSNSEINDDLDLIGIDKITSGWEYGGSLRYGISPKASIDAEFNSINGKSSTSDSPNPDIEASTTGMAVPLSLYYTLSENDDALFNLFIGAGPMFSTKYKLEQGSNSIEGKGKTTFYAHLGLEAQYKLSPTFALTARALGRLAKASDVEDKDDPSNTEDVDLSGAAFSLGARLYFGGGAAGN